MLKKSADKIQVFFISIFSCLVLFSCANSSSGGDSEPAYTEKTEESNEASHSAMIGTWVNPDDNSDVITISERTVAFSLTATKKYISEGYTQPYETEVSTAKTVNYEYIQKMKDDCIKYGYGDVQTYVKKNDTEYYTWLEKIDAEFTNNLKLFQKKPSLFFGFREYNYLWLDNEELNIRYIKDFNCESGKECKYIRKGSGSQTNPSDNIDITGSYTISEANGSTFTFAQDGSWTYKYNSSTSEGTWTFADGELTITYSLGGYSSTAVFTVSVSDDTYTLTGKSGDTTTIIASAFKITDQEALENGVVTLVKQ